MIRLGICDDHPVVRTGLKAVFNLAKNIEVVGAVASAAEAVKLAPECDVMTMDLRLGEGQDGVSVTRQVMSLAQPPKVLVLTNYDTDAGILAAVEAGAVGYLLKDAEPEQLTQAVERAARGETVLEPRILTKLTQQVRRPRTRLTAREHEVLQLVARGFTNTAIAGELHVSIATVKSHLASIYEKLGVSSRTAALAEARERALL